LISVIVDRKSKITMIVFVMNNIVLKIDLILYTRVKFWNKYTYIF